MQAANRKIKSLFTLLTLLIIAIIHASGQSPDRVNVVFKGFQAPPNLSHSGNIDIMSERMLTKLIAVQKFNVVKRDDSMWKSIEEELKIQDFIDQSTAVRLGNMLGARFYLEGKISELSSQRFEQRSSSGEITGVAFNAVGEASLNLINLETGRYDISVTSKQKVTEREHDASIQAVMSLLVNDLAEKLSKKFLIIATIKSVEPSGKVKIDKGSHDGVSTQQLFNVVNNSAIDLRIIETSANEATAQIIKGNKETLSAGQKVIESELAGTDMVYITKKEKNYVYMDIGKNLDVKEGDIFVSKKATQLDIGSQVITEEVVNGAIYIVDVKANYSKGKIYKGYTNINAGTLMFKRKEEQSYRTQFYTLGYKHGLTQQIQNSPVGGIVTITVGTTSHDVNTEYNSELKPLKSVSIYSMSFGVHNSVKETSTAINVDIYNIGNGVLKTWIPSLEVTYEPVLLPEKLNWMIGGAIGYGRLKQNIPNSTVPILSNGKSNYIQDNAIPGSIVTGLKFTFKRFRLASKISYDFLRFHSFDYDIDNDDPDGPTSATAPDQIVPYPNVNLSGLYIKGTISYHITD